MPLLNRKRVILAKIEATYGIDSVPTGGANAILVKNLNFTPQEVNLASRDVVRPFLGNFQNLPAAIYGKVDFEVELAGAGTAGTAPGYGSLLRGCALAETLLAAPTTGTATAGGLAQATLAAGASAVDNTYNGMTIAITGGTGAGQSGVVKSYVGATKIATMTANWATPTDATSVYSIAAQAVYTPVSAAFESLSIYFNVDGVQHRLLGSRGSVSMSFSVFGIPTFKFSFTGIYTPVTDTAMPTVTLSAFQVPQAVNNTNTSGVLVHGYAGAVLSDLSIDLANSVTYRSLVGGQEQVVLTDRKGAGSVTVEATTVAAKDWWTASKNAALAPLSITHGTTVGNKVKVDAPAVQITKPTYSEKDMIQMLQMGLVLLPSAQNDELTISVQ